MSKLDVVAAEAMRCTRRELYACGTRTVFGQGPPDADVMLIGERPGDKAAGIDRDRTYVTNAVKHFRWEAPRAREGSRSDRKARIHKKPGRKHIEACRPWLDAELSIVQPELVVLLGATAAQARLGSKFRVTQHRGELIDDTDIASGPSAGNRAFWWRNIALNGHESSTRTESAAPLTSLG